MARRMAGVGLVTVSLRRSIIKTRSNKFGEYFVREQHPARRQAQTLAVDFNQPLAREFLHRRSEWRPIRLHTFIQAQPQEEAFPRVGGGLRNCSGLAALGTFDIIARALGILP